MLDTAIAADFTQWIGKAVTFRDGIETWDEWIDAGMRGRITAIEKMDDDNYKIHVDTTEFEEFNRPLETATYFDKKGQPTLTAREAGYFSLKTTGYCPEPEQWGSFFVPFNEDPNITKVMAAHREAADAGSYVAFLEAQLSAAMDQGFKITT